MMTYCGKSHFWILEALLTEFQNLPYRCLCILTVSSILEQLGTPMSHHTRADSLEKILMWEGLKAGEGNNRG